MADEDAVVLVSHGRKRTVRGKIVFEDASTLHLQQPEGWLEIPKKYVAMTIRRPCQHQFKHYSLELEKWICDSCGFPIPDRKEDDL